MKCKDCKQFHPIGEFQGECTSDNFKAGYGPKFTDYDTEDCYDNVHPNQVLVENDEGWGFRVGKDFGCVHFEAVAK